ncbi:ArsR/SmtB family transcription factor [Paeniglutamicibacter sp. NPDC091659]|uniref:ArsR/SmtB family transcription factor n=1 Tax=Paeniglutamicibacter sp. NPDC091659 TaxID=3364389 RepID=UPI0038262481
MVGVELLLKALADPTRAHILDELVDRDGQTLFEICARLAAKHGITPTRQAVSQHLAVLEDAGLLHSERSGRYKFHYLDTSPLQEIFRRWPQQAQTDKQASTEAGSGHGGGPDNQIASSSERTKP